MITKSNDLQLQTTNSKRFLRATAELEFRKRVGGSFQQFARWVKPDFIWYKHCVVLGNVLERVVRGELRRVMVFEPPRHGKSEQTSRLFPAYYLYRNTRRTVGLTSYTAALATGLSRSARDYYTHSGRRYRFNASASREWHTEDGGMMWACGVGGPITGRGFDLGIIDDPFKNSEEADSQRIREGRMEWYDSTFYTRQSPDAAIVLIQTRWHEDDIAGRLLRRERENPERWHIVMFDALKSDVPFDIPETCTIEPDWRAPGKALCPQRYSKRKLEDTRKTIGSRFFLSLYQQRPTAEEGNIWKREWFGNTFQLGSEPHLVDDGFDWDLAYTENDVNSASAYVRSARDREGNVYILDLGFDWKEFPELIKWMKSLRGPHYIEAKASGKSARQVLQRELIAATEIAVDGGDKISRTKLVTPLAENGKVFVASHIIEKLLDDDRQGIIRFPAASHDDVNDALVQALNRHGNPVKLEFTGKAG